MTAAATPSSPLGYIESRLANRRVLVVFVGLFAVVVIGAAALIALGGPGSLAPQCAPGDPCAGPPPGRPPLVNRATWTSPELGLRIEYSPRTWTRIAQTSRTVTLRFAGGADLQMVIGGAPRSQASPTALVESQLGAIRDRVVSLAVDSDPAHEILGPTVGFVPGVGGAYVATSTSGQGAEAPLHLAILAASAGPASAFVTVVTSIDDPMKRSEAYGLADVVLNSLRWDGEQ